MAKTRSEISLPTLSSPPDPAGAEFWPQVLELLSLNPPDIDAAASILAREERGGRKVAELFAMIVAERRRLKPLADGLEQASRDLADTEHRLQNYYRFQPRTLDEAAEQAKAVDETAREKSRLMNLAGECFQAVGHLAWCEQFAYELFGLPRPQRILGTMPESVRPFLVAVGGDPMTLDSWLPRNTAEKPRRKARLFTPDRPRN